MQKSGASKIIFLALVMLVVFVWYRVFSGRPGMEPRVYFLDVGQGDAELVIFPGNVKVMTDAGPDKKVLTSLEKALPSGDRYIDLAVISHPQLDHFNGYNFVLDNYRVGAFIYNGRDDTKNVQEWPVLLTKIKSMKIPLITLSAGDRVHFADNQMDFLSPGKEFIQSAELNDIGFVEMVTMRGFKTLLTADIDFNVEDWLVKSGADLRANVLKVPHHGSKYSSGDAFLRAVASQVDVIEVGEKNHYGHPATEALARLTSSSAKIFRTDRNGTVKVSAENQKLKIFTER